MAKRSGYRQTCHDNAVSRSAGQLVAWGYKVWADIPGYPTPQKLCVDDDYRRPDIIAKKGRRIQVIEWETPESVEKDNAQHHVLRTWGQDEPELNFIEEFVMYNNFLRKTKP